MNKTVNIVGTKYNIIEDDALIRQGFDGVHEYYENSISVRPVQNMLSSDKPDSAKELRYKECLRHELIHAFFSESGLDNYSSNEELVDWLAMQFPKIVKVFEELGVLC